MTPQWALMYSAYFYSQSVLETTSLSGTARDALSGALCGLAVASVTAPVDSVKVCRSAAPLPKCSQIRAQNERLSAGEVLRRLLATGGLGALGHGMLATIIHLVLSQARASLSFQ